MYGPCPRNSSRPSAHYIANGTTPLPLPPPPSPKIDWKDIILVVEFYHLRKSFARSFYFGCVWNLFDVMASTTITGLHHNHPAICVNTHRHTHTHIHRRTIKYFSVVVFFFASLCVTLPEWQAFHFCLFLICIYLPPKAF